MNTELVQSFENLRDEVRSSLKQHLFHFLLTCQEYVSEEEARYILLQEIKTIQKEILQEENVEMGIFKKELQRLYEITSTNTSTDFTEQIKLDTVAQAASVLIHYFESEGEEDGN